MPREKDRETSQRAIQAVDRFVGLVGALERGRLRQAAREQVELRRLGFDVDVRPLAPTIEASEGEQ
jgi:hypothetical protein